MSAESQTIRRRGMFTRINDFLAGGPLAIPDAIANLEAIYRPLPIIVFDSQEQRQIDDALAAVDASTVIAREGVRHGDNIIANAFFGPGSLPDASQRSSNRVEARHAARRLLESLGVNKVLTISQPTEKSPTQLVARRLHKVIGDSLETSRAEDAVREVRRLRVEEHVSNLSPSNPGTYTTERTCTRKVRFYESRPQEAP